jgi:hypothetical protein
MTARASGVSIRGAPRVSGSRIPPRPSAATLMTKSLSYRAFGPLVPSVCLRQPSFEPGVAAGSVGALPDVIGRMDRLLPVGVLDLPLILLQQRAELVAQCLDSIQTALLFGA